MTAVVDVKRVSTTFTHTDAMDNVSVAIESDEVHALLGQSSSGNSIRSGSCPDTTGPTRAVVSGSRSRRSRSGSESGQPTGAGASTTPPVRRRTPRAR